MGAGSFNNQTREVVYFTPVATLANNGDCAGGWCRPALGTFGNIQRNSFTGPGEFRSDMSLFKNFTITENVKAQFQAQFFNVFNHPVYNTPGSTCIDCSDSGLITNIEPDTSMREMQLGVRVTF